MKKLLIIAAIVLSALTLSAQGTNGYYSSPVASDSVSVILRHLANTNAEVVSLNDNLRLHSQLALGSFALEGIGAACLLIASNSKETDKAISYKRIGIGFGVAGALGFIGSYIPIWTNKIRLDSQGLIIVLP